MGNLTKKTVDGPMCPYHGPIAPFVYKRFGNLVQEIESFSHHLSEVEGLNPWMVRCLKINVDHGDMLRGIQLDNKHYLLIQTFDDDAVRFNHNIKPFRAFLLLEGDCGPDEEYLSKFLEKGSPEMRAALKQSDINLMEISNWAQNFEYQNKMARIGYDSKPASLQALMPNPMATVNPGLNVSAYRGYADSDKRGYTPIMRYTEIECDREDVFMGVDIGYGKAIIAMYILRYFIDKIKDYSSRVEKGLQNTVNKVVDSVREALILPDGLE